MDSIPNGFIRVFGPHIVVLDLFPAHATANMCELPATKMATFQQRKSYECRDSGFVSIVEIIYAKVDCRQELIPGSVAVSRETLLNVVGLPLHVGYKTLIVTV